MIDLKPIKYISALTNKQPYWEQNPGLIAQLGHQKAIDEDTEDG